MSLSPPSLPLCARPQAPSFSLPTLLLAPFPSSLTAARFPCVLRYLPCSTLPSPPPRSRLHSLLLPLATALQSPSSHPFVSQFPLPSAHAFPPLALSLLHPLPLSRLYWRPLRLSSPSSLSLTSSLFASLRFCQLELFTPACSRSPHAESTLASRCTPSQPAPADG